MKYSAQTEKHVVDGQPVPDWYLVRVEGDLLLANGLSAILDIEYKERYSALKDRHLIWVPVLAAMQESPRPPRYALPVELTEQAEGIASEWLPEPGETYVVGNLLRFGLALGAVRSPDGLWLSRFTVGTPDETLVQVVP